MLRLKQEGFTTLFMEHLNYDNQNELDHDALEDLSSQSAELLSYLDDGSDINDESYNFLEVVKAAKKVGIRVVGIDTEYTYTEQNNRERMQYAYGDRTGFTKDNY